MNSLFKGLLCLEILGLGTVGAIALAQPIMAHPLLVGANGAEIRQPQPLTVADSRSNTAAREHRAFDRSSYDYWDARVLAEYWGQSTDEAKARIGRKILWGKKDVAILEQFLVDARIQHLESIAPASSPASYTFYRESGYTYNDAEVLAKFWGDASPMDAKLRIERNLTLGNREKIDAALGMARQ